MCIAHHTTELEFTDAGMKTILLLILVATITGCGALEAPKVESEKEELQLSCSMTRTEFAVGQKLPPPKVMFRNNTDTDVDLIGPTLSVVVCTLIQPDMTAVPMCIAMPTGRDPRQMPTRKLEARTTIEFKPGGIWYYQDGRGFESYVFQQEGTYEFQCKYEQLNSNTITITARKNATEQAAQPD